MRDFTKFFTLIQELVLILSAVCVNFTSTIVLVYYMLAFLNQPDNLLIARMRYNQMHQQVRSLHIILLDYGRHIPNLQNVPTTDKYQEWHFTSASFVKSWIASCVSCCSFSEISVYFVISQNWRKLRLGVQRGRRGAAGLRCVRGGAVSAADAPGGARARSHATPQDRGRLPSRLRQLLALDCFVFHASSRNQ